MKKLFFLFIAAGYLLGSCNGGGEKTITALTDTSSANSTRKSDAKVDYKVEQAGLAALAIDTNEVRRGVAYYQNLLKNNPKYAILQVKLEIDRLRPLLIGADGFKLIFYADNKNKVGVYLQRLTAAGPFYYDITYLRGEEPVICNNWGSCKDFEKSSNPEILTETDVTEWAQRYADFKKTDSSILQITMAPIGLLALLESTQRLKIICVLSPANKFSAVLQFWKGETTYDYYEINMLFSKTQRGMNNTSPVCPPPEACGVPFMELYKANLKIK